MKIFDGVTVNPNNLSPTLQGLLGVAMLFAGTLVEADKERQRRAAGTKEQATTLEEVMEQSGLDLPRLEEALAKLMGGSPEAKEAASFIAKAPDPAKLLQQFAHLFTAAYPHGDAIVTPPPAATEAPATRPRAAQFRPEFTREGMEAAANAGPRPRPKLAQFRPEFTREGMEAAKSAAPASAASAPSSPQTASTAGPPAASSPTVASAVSPTPPPTSPAGTSPSSAPAKSPAGAPTLSEALARRLAVRDRRIAAHQAELVTRVRCVEAELALLREEMHELQRTRDCPVVFLVPSEESLPALTASDTTPPSSETPGSAEERTAEAQEEAAHVAIRAASETSVPDPAASAATAPPVACCDIPSSGTETEPADQDQVIELAEQTPPTSAAPAAMAEGATAAPDACSSRDSETPAAPAATAATVPDAITAPGNSGEGQAYEGGTPSTDEEPLPTPVSEADLVQAVEMLDEFSERTEAHYIQEIEHVKGLEGDVKLLRALVARELVAKRAASHG